MRGRSRRNRHAGLRRATSHYADTGAAARYDGWFDRHGPAFRSELGVLGELVPPGVGLEIGVGTGRFAHALGIAVGVDPAVAMLRRARARGVRAVAGVAEQLPFADGRFDFVLSVTALCFMADPRRMVAEAFRVLRPGGRCIVALLDPESAAGRDYLAAVSGHGFYRGAVFRGAGEVAALLAGAGFTAPVWRQTLTLPPDALTGDQPPMEGHGTGIFAAVGVRRPE